MANKSSGIRFKRGRRRSAEHQARHRPAPEMPSTSLIFETFEQRVLMDAALPIVLSTTLPNGTILASDAAPALVQDADGTTVSVTISGNGHWKIVQADAAPALDVFGAVKERRFVELDHVQPHVIHLLFADEV